ncbi:MAG: NitT/TauT family transport system ATP-binding protein [Hyphomicrobiales bacterium]|nr:NitT/TauT family transport system ATP-binding protein [Hyphomicrobiales bacterium]
MTVVQEKCVLRAMDIPSPLLSVDNVSFSVPVAHGKLTILQNISLDVRQGEFLSIIGGSGCGKTTLLRLIGGLNLPSEGRIVFDGVAVERPSRKRAVVFQDYSKALLPWRTVTGNIELALDTDPTPRDKATKAKIIEKLLAQVGLTEAADRFPRQLSGGMQQRLQIARCLALEPKMLLMDEPFGALDAMTRQTLQDEIAKLAKETGMTVIFITHDIEEAIYLGDRVCAMESRPGRISAVLDIDLKHPRDQLTTREDQHFLRYRHELFRYLPQRH